MILPRDLMVSSRSPPPPSWQADVKTRSPIRSGTVRRSRMSASSGGEPRTPGANALGAAVVALSASGRQHFPASRIGTLGRMTVTSTPLSRASTIPSRFYLDPSILDAEKERVFGRTWQLVARYEDLSRIGDF